MQNLIIDNISLSILIPLWIFLIIMCGRFLGVYVNKKIIYILTLLASLIGCIICFYGIQTYTAPLETSFHFINIGNFSITYGLYVDKLSLYTALLLYVISFCVQLYTISYMKSDKKNYRFFALLNLFNFAMAALLFSPNLYQLYVFWEIVGIVSYLFIGFDYTKSEKSKAAQKVFLLNRVGDTALITGILITTYIMYNYASDPSLAILSISDLNITSTLLAAFTSTPVFIIICTLFIIGATVKSAQFPFHIWLQDAMEAKIPVSALLHSATIVAAGVYLIIRLLPFFTLHSLLLKIIVIIGLLTALITSIAASIEVHPKKILAYSTSANLGLIIALIGMGNIKAALVFLIAHGLTKANLFLCLPNNNNRISYSKFIILAISSFSVAGLIFSGILCKEFVFNTLKYNALLCRSFLIIVFLSTFYIIRFIFLVHKNSQKFRQINIPELTSITILLLLNIGLYLYITKGIFSITIPYVISVLALIIVFLLNKFNLLTKIQTYPDLCKKILYEYSSCIYNKASKIATIIELNIFNNYKTVKFSAKFCIESVNYIEQNIINKTVCLIEKTAKSISQKDKIFQDGNVQTYNAYALILATIIIVIVTMSYLYILTQLRM